MICNTFEITQVSMFVFILILFGVIVWRETSLRGQIRRLQASNRVAGIIHRGVKF